MDRTITVEIHDDEIVIGEDNSSGVRCLLLDKDNPLDAITKVFSEYVYTYLSGVDDNV